MDRTAPRQTISSALVAALEGSAKLHYSALEHVNRLTPKAAATLIEYPPLLEGFVAVCSKSFFAELTMTPALFRLAVIGAVYDRAQDRPVIRPDRDVK